MTAVALSVVAGLAVAGALSHRYAWWRRPADYRHPRILMYHMISQPRPKCRFNKLRVAPAALERQLGWLTDNGWRFAFLSEIGGPVPPKTVVLTFDDGYRDNYLAAHPLLERYGAKATLFLVVDRFNRDWSRLKKARHDSGELAAEPKLRADDLRAMLASGVWELGAHTHTHPVLPNLTAADRRREIAGSKTALEQEFGVPVLSFAYPFGIYGEADVAAVRDAGYRYAVTTNAGVSRDVNDDAFALRRVKVSGKDGLLAFRLRLRAGKRGVKS